MLIALWIVTALLAVAMLGAGTLKLVRPRTALIDAGMPWAADFTPAAIRVFALLEVIGAVGLILPLITGIAPVLNPLAAVGVAALMIGAVVVHRRRRDPVIPPAVLAVIAIVSAILGFAAL
jgi:hypothetical protein